MPKSDEPERNLGGLLVKLLKFYGHTFDARSMGVSVIRSGGQGEYVLREREHAMPFESQQPAWAAQQGAPPGGHAFPYSARRRPAFALIVTLCTDVRYV